VKTDENDQTNQVFTEKYLTSDYLIIGTSHHSRKIDFLKEVEFTHVKLPYVECLTEVQVTYKPFMLLLKTYRSYEMVYKDEKT
jgi:hypothetical protein